MKYWYILFFSCVAFAQNDSINLLDEVKLYGNFSAKINAGYQIIKLNDSIINNQQQSLGNLLQNNANLYFKQNGNGMVSSISLRGSGATSTGVYWNGIAINSALNGQTDFNTISANGYNQIEIRKGSGSVLFGSGAIGGAINLSDKIYFTSNKNVKLNLGYGSYNTQNLALKTKWSTSKVYTKIVVNGEASDNDYPFLDSEITNENGAYKKYNLKGVFAYKLNKNNQLQLHSNYSYNDREFSRTLVAPNNSEYKNDDLRLLLNWKNSHLRYNSSFKLAFLKENYKFFLNKETTNFLFGKTNSYIGKYDFNYSVTKNLSLHTGVENKFVNGNGSSIQDKERNDLDIYFLLHQQPIKKWLYNVSLRQGFSSIYKVPLIYAIDSKYNLNSKFALRGNFSTNFRLPTFNDLFWEESGNEDLLPEKSNTSEIGVDYKFKNTSVSVTTFYTKSKNLIQWRPVSSTFWRPINVQNVESYGLEFEFEIHKRIGKHQIKFQTQYAYTISEDKELNKQLIYNPFHKANASLHYNYIDWSLNFNQQYNGEVFTTTSNTKTIDDFWLSNIQIHKTFLKNKLNIGLFANNIFNIKYETVAFRPMPNQNYNIQLTLNY